MNALTHITRWSLAVCFLLAVEFTHAKEIIELGQFDPPEHISDIAVNGNWVYLANDETVYVVDASNPNAMRLATVYQPGGGNSLNGGITHISFEGQHLYAWTTNGRLYVINMANPYAPWLSSSAQHGSDILRYSQQITVQNGRAYLCKNINIDYGVTIVDVGDPSRQRFLGGIGTMAEVAMPEGSKLYVGHGNGEGLAVYDIANPSAPRLLGKSRFGYSSLTVNGIARVGDFLVLATSQGVLSVNVMDVLNMRLVDSREIQAYYSIFGVTDVVAMGESGCVAAYESGIAVFTLDSDGNFLAEDTIARGADRLAASGNRLFSAAGTIAIGAYDIVESWKNVPLVAKGSTSAYKATTNSPLEILGDGWSIWTIAPTSSRLQVTWWEKGWRHYRFTATDGAPVLNSWAGMASDDVWDILWAIDIDRRLWATWFANGRWNHAPVGTGSFTRIHYADSKYHALWARKNINGVDSDVVVYLAGGVWREKTLPTGSTVAFSGFDSASSSLLGWKSDGSLVKRTLVGGEWTLRNIPGAGRIGTRAGDSRTALGYDSAWRIFWYGTNDGALGWTSLAASSGNSGAIHRGLVAPFSPTWVSSSKHWVFCRDGEGVGNSVRVFYWSGSQWLSTPVGPYSYFQGDQAKATSYGRLYYVSAQTGTIGYIGW